MLSIAVVSNNRNKYSETFIHTQVAKLPADVHLLYGGYLPVMHGNDQPLSLKKLLKHQLFGLSQKQATVLLKKGIKAYLKKNNIQAVLSQYGPSGVAMMDICQEMNIPLIVHFHGFDAYREDILRDFGGEYPALFETATAICVSTDMQRQLLKLGAKPEVLRLIPYGVDTELFKPGRAKMYHPVFMACGRFVPKKAPHLTIRAFAETITKVPDARLVLIGEGALLPSCRSLADSLGIAHAVDFRGILTQNEIADLLQQTLVFVQHSVRCSNGDAEGLPLAILDAGASGVPVVATRHTGILEAVEEGKTGFLIEEGDTAAMADYMTCLAQNPVLAAKMGEAARQRVCLIYNEDRYMKELWDIILKRISTKNIA